MPSVNRIWCSSVTLFSLQSLLTCPQESTNLLRVRRSKMTRYTRFSFCFSHKGGSDLNEICFLSKLCSMVLQLLLSRSESIFCLQCKVHHLALHMKSGLILNLATASDS